MSALRLLAAAAMFFAAPAFAEEDTLTIGMTLSQTGPLNVDSVAQQRGAELWRDQVNEAGGLKVGDKRYKLRYVTYDDQSQGGRVQQLYTRLIVQDKLVRDGRWAEGRPMLSKIPRLMGQTLGLISFGHVARAVARRAKAFGLHVIAYDPFIEELVAIENGVEPVSLPELLQRADIISMHAPATESANRLIREEHFRQMKKTAIYISTGRGPTTDEAALIKALDEGMIAAAGLDVLEQEPPGDNNPLLRMDNVILTAHVASASSRFDPARRRRVGQELSLVLSGRWPMSCVNPSVLAKSDLKRWQPVSMQRGPNS